MCSPIPIGRWLLTHGKLGVFPTFTLSRLFHFIYCYHSVLNGMHMQALWGWRQVFRVANIFSCCTVPVLHVPFGLISSLFGSSKKVITSFANHDRKPSFLLCIPIIPPFLLVKSLSIVDAAIIWKFPKMGVPKNGWFIRKIPSNRMIWGAPLFQESPMSLETSTSKLEARPGSPRFPRCRSTMISFSISSTGRRACSTVNYALLYQLGHVHVRNILQSDLIEVCMHACMHACMDLSI